MKKNQRWFVVIAGILVISVLFVLIVLDKKEIQNIPNSIYQQNQEENSKQSENNNDLMSTWEEGEVAQDAPSGIKVPEAGESIPEGLEDVLAVPNEVVPVAPGVDAHLRIFKIKAENNKFTPSQIIVKYDDTVHIDVTAIDKDYDFVLEGYNMKQSIGMGFSKALEFQAIKTGRFLYYCDVCGGVESGAYGEIIIVE